MPIGINQSISPFLFQKDSAGRGIQKGFQRLSTGFRINKASDDAAGLGISENLNALIRSLGAAERNTNNAISLASVADGGLDQVSQITTRMRELAVQAADGGLNETDRGYIDTEYQQLREELDRVSGSTTFNDKQLIGGPAQTIDFQVGEGSGPSNQISVNVGGIDSTTLGLDTTGVGGPDGASAKAAIDAIDAAQAQINERRSELGAASNRLESAAQNSRNRQVGLVEANSRIRDADFAEETSKLAGNKVLQRVRIAIRSQANQQGALALTLLK
jgi:flagellin